MAVKRKLFMYVLIFMLIWQFAGTAAANTVENGNDLNDEISLDLTAPVFNGVGAKTIKVGSSFNPKTGVTAIDETDGDVTASISVTGSVKTAVPGIYQLTYRVRDLAGNEAVIIREITVKDHIKPVISGAGNKTINLNTTFHAKTGVTAKDNIDGNVTSNLKVSGTVNTKKPGTYNLTYTVSDKAGNVSTHVRKITVKDHVKPVISGASNQTIFTNVSFNTKTGVTAKDNIDGNVTSKLKISGKVNVKKSGKYTLTYTVTDKAGNKASVKRTITVKTAPKEKAYKNCTELNKVYPGGVAKSASVKNKGGKTNHAPFVSKTLYELNKGKDRDKDSIACER